MRGTGGPSLNISGVDKEGVAHVSFVCPRSRSERGGLSKSANRGSRALRPFLIGLEKTFSGVKKIMRARDLCGNISLSYMLSVRRPGSFSFLNSGKLSEEKSGSPSFVLSGWRMFPGGRGPCPMVSYRPSLISK